MEKITNFLVVDDDEIDRTIAFSIIKYLDSEYSYVSAENGLEALSKIKEHEVNFPLLILLDINMPVMNGFSFLEELSRLNLEQPVYVAVISSSNHSKDITKAFEYNIVDYVEKPITKAVILNLLEKIISCNLAK